jgi:hypothetical protein
MANDGGGSVVGDFRRHPRSDRFHYKRHDWPDARLVRGSYVNVKRLPELAPMTIDTLFVSVTIHYPTSRDSAIGQMDKASARDVQRVR